VSKLDEIARHIADKTRRFNRDRVWNEQTGDESEESSFKPDPTTAISPEDPTTMPRVETDPYEPMRFAPGESMGTVVTKVLQQQLGQQEGKPYSPGPDLGEVPNGQRYDEVLDASGVQETRPAGVPASTQATPAPRSRVQQLQEQYDSEQESYQHPKDRNGRFVSSLLALLDGAGEGARDVLSSGRPVDTYGIANIAGRAIGAGARGGVQPQLDERQKSKNRMLDLKQQIGEAVAIQRAQAQTQATATRAAGGQNPVQLATRRQSFSNFISKFYPNGYKRGMRQDIDAELERLQMEPPPALPKKAGPGKPMVASPGQGVLVSDGSGGYEFKIPHGEEGAPAPQMTPYQEAQISDGERDLAVRLGQYNLSRAYANLPPVTFEDWKAAGSPDAPQAGGAAASGSQRGPAPTAPAQPTPAETIAPSGIRPRGAKLVPSGTPPEAVPSRGSIRPRARSGRFRAGRAASAGSSSSGGLDKYQESALMRAENESAQSRARAEAARARGDDKEADAHDEAARVAEETAAKLRKKGGITTAAPAPAARPPRREGLIPRMAGKVSRAKFVEKNPQYQGKPQADIDAAIRGDGYEPY
jgi:hypothetical protein